MTALNRHVIIEYNETGRLDYSRDKRSDPCNPSRLPCLHQDVAALVDYHFDASAVLTSNEIQKGLGLHLAERGLIPWGKSSTQS